MPVVAGSVFRRSAKVQCSFWFHKRTFCKVRDVRFILPLVWLFLREDVQRRAGRILFSLAKVPARNSALQSGRLVDVFPRHRCWMVHFKDTVIDRVTTFWQELTQWTLYLKSEDKPDCRIDCVAIEVAVSQSIIDLREHEPDVSLELRRKPPIDGE